MLDREEYSSEYVGSQNSTTKKKKSKNKSRFSDQQIRALEVMFESDTKLRPEKKVQLAAELGLQPRQVAIWFQNKRARWKSKHIEKEYAILLADYNSLCSKFESLEKENQSLVIQMEKLKNEKIRKCGEKGTDWKVKNIGSRCLGGMVTVSDDDGRMMGVDEEVLKMVAADCSLTSVEDWGSFDSGDVINQTSDGSIQLWDF